MKNFKIGSKLLAGFGIITLILIVCNLLGMRALASNDEHLMAIEKSDTLADNAQNIMYFIPRIVDSTKNLMLVESIDEKKQILAQIGEFRGKYKENLDALVKNARTEEGMRLAKNLKEAIGTAKETAVKLIDLAMRNDRESFSALWLREGYVKNERIFALCAEAQAYFSKQSGSSIDGARSSNRQAERSLIVLSIVALACCLLVAWYATRMITRPIRSCVEVADRIAAGDLTVGIDATGTDETAQLMQAMQRMTASLSETMATLTLASASITSAAEELNSTSGLMAQGAEEVVAQASSVATSGEQMAATAQDIARSCHLTALSADKANTVAQEGFRVVESSVAAMHAIALRVKSAGASVDGLGSRSQQIGEIVGAIEDIADQTNLLALNAAIEAARAGEQGRGFAVVADEVRALAERTARATREIGGMIKTIQSETKGAVTAMEEGVREVEIGTSEAARSGKALQAILHQINEVTQQANQIATAAEQQTATTGEISSNMQDITAIVQRSAAGAAETAGSANRLSHLADDLQRIVGQFKVAA